MRCEEVLEQLPDYSLGTLSDVAGAAVRRHLRGCGPCREEAARLDEGVAMFANAAAIDPPPGLRAQVMSVLVEERQEGQPDRHASRRRLLGWMAVAATVVALAGALTWGGLTQVRSNHLAEDASSYRSFLHALGGLDVRVATLTPRSGFRLEGSAVLYDSDRGQSWVLVTVRTLGFQGSLTATLSGRDGHSIELPHPIEVDAEGDGAAWLVTAADIQSLQSVTLRGPGGAVVAWGTTGEGRRS